MFKRTPHACYSGFLNSSQLKKLKQKAMRQGVWFKALHRIDRVLFDLTIRIGASVRSPTLARSILAVTRKLDKVMQSKFARVIKEIGVPLSCKVSLLAQKWGHGQAWEWMSDLTFARYLAVMKING